jgi:23S rRNA (cytidine1920-2'-O)/16S rRNA (cytidine1409-2'-O)-methyltransferase
MRLDRALVERGLVPTRSRAQAEILAGRVRVNKRPVTKAGYEVGDGDEIELVPVPRFASRGGEKLFAALERFRVPVAGRVCLDAGASTGGFTDCLLAFGARRVYAVDVGYGQLLWRLRQDPRVVVMERTNLRHLTPERVPEPIDLVTLDLSFIGLAKVLPAVRGLLGPGGDVVALVKPQFEVGPERVGKGGVVRDPADWRAALEGVAGAFAAAGLGPRALMASPLLGPKGNVEFLLWARHGDPAVVGPDTFQEAIEEAGLLVQEKELPRRESDG